MSDNAAVSEFLKEFWGHSTPMADDHDILDGLGIEGDDASDFIERFAATFEIDVSNYLWYFHHGDEAFHIGVLFVRPPDRRVVRIPITPAILNDAIRAKRWPVEYPEHQLPSTRWDVWISWAFSALLLLPFPVAVIYELWHRIR